jgi:uncharacterized lipoprotein YmbA
MMEKVQRSIRVISLLLLMIWLVGCTTPSQPSRFYRLESTTALAAMPQPGAPGQSLPLIGVGPVQLAGYLDRPQMVERSSSHRLRLREFDRWAGTLQENTIQVLIDVLQRELDMAQVVAYPWHGSVRPEYEVVVAINRFERQGARVRLDASWTLVAQPHGQLVNLGRQSFETPVSGSDVEDVVAAASLALEQLGRILATELESLPSLQR